MKQARWALVIAGLSLTIATLIVAAVPVAMHPEHKGRLATGGHLRVKAAVDVMLCDGRSRQSTRSLYSRQHAAAAMPDNAAT
jgi:hypothetical protein